MIAEVIVDIATSETDRIFDYICDDDMLVGSRVSVPFGAKHITGFVMRVKETSSYPTAKLKRIANVLDDLPALNTECLRLAEKLANRYRVPKALTLRLFLPTEMRTGKVRELTRRYAELVDGKELQFSKTAKNQIAAAEYLRQNGKTDCALLNQQFPGSVKALEKKGYIQITVEQVKRNPYQSVPSQSVPILYLLCSLPRYSSRARAKRTSFTAVSSLVICKLPLSAYHTF